MSKRRDVERILILIPSPLEPTATRLADARKRLSLCSKRELRNMRESLESVVSEYVANPSPRWEEAMARVNNMTDIAPLLQQWEVLNRHAGEFLKEFRVT